MRNCVDEGMLQGYLDGELSPTLMDEVAAHLASCMACADAAGEAQSELEVFAAAFAAETSVSVPTERLRERIDAAIHRQPAPAVEPSRVNRLVAALAAFLTLTPQRATAFASLALVITFAVIFATVRSRTNTPETTGEGGSEITALAPASGEQPVVAETPQTTHNSETGKTISTAPVSVAASDAAIVKAGAGRSRVVRHSADAVNPARRGRGSVTTATVAAQQNRRCCPAKRAISKPSSL